MGETLDQTRVEIADQRASMERTAEQLRDALDLRKRFAENPALFVGIGAGALFLLAGGPVRVAKLIRRRVMPTRTEAAYDALPKSLQRWVDSVAGDIGPKAEQARDALAEELVRWRHAPLKDRKARKEIAKAMAEGPPGPARSGWKAFEAAAAILSAALARKAVERFLSGEPPSGHPALDAAGTAGGAAEPEQPRRPGPVTNAAGERLDYSGMSAKARNG